jgi:tetratricopeptide (TPR) repeat protein
MVVNLLVWLWLSLPVRAQPDAATQASAAYLAGDYTTAARLFRALVDAGAGDPALYFNLGSAYYQSGDWGNALLYYLRAQQYIPRDADLNTILAQVRAQRTDIQGDETGFAEGLAALTTAVLTLRELAVLTLVLWIAWFGLLAAGILQRRRLSSLRAPLLVLGVVVLVALALLAGRLFVRSNRPAAVVLAEAAPVMSGPGGDYLLLYDLHAAAEIRILRQSGDWIRFELPDGRQGWMLVSAAERVEASSR